jgi:2-polyprenyl-6-methoxyphenol hydroxylase-like FAD-dependent oxidoreductase
VMHHQEGDFLADGTRQFPLYFATRPRFEHVIRQRVAALDAVTFRSRCQWTDYLVDESATTVTGVAVDAAKGRSEELDADLVVDATGRTSSSVVLNRGRIYSNVLD